MNPLISGNIYTGGLVGKLAKEAASTIGHELFESLQEFIAEIIANCVDGVANQAFSILSPGLGTVNTFLSTDSFDFVKSVLKGGQLFGAFVVLMLLVFYFIKLMVNPKGMDQTPFQVIAKTAVACFLIATCEDVIHQIFNTFYNLSVKMYGAASESVDFSNLIFLDHDNCTIVGFHLPFLEDAPFASGLDIILALIVCWPLIKNLIRFVLEMIERYLICVIVALFLPAVAGTLVSKETENIFKSWGRTLAAQLFLLCMNGLFLRVALALILNSGSGGLFKYLFCLGYLRVIQRLDAILQSMGLNIAQCTGGIMDSLVSAGKGLANGLRHANNMRTGAGEMMKAIGASTGNQAMFAAGAMAGISAKSIASNGLPTTANLNSSYAKQRASYGMGSTFEGSKAHDMVQKSLQNPGANRTVASGLSQSTLNDGIGSMVAGANLSNVHDASLRGNSATFKAIGADGVNREYSISNNSQDGRALPLKDASGNDTGLYLNSTSAMQNGDSVTGSLDNIAAETGSLGITADPVFANVDNASYDNGAYTFSSDGENVGMIDKNGNVLKNHGLTNDAYFDDEELNTDFKRAYGDYEIKEGFHRNGDSVEALVQKNGEDGYHKVYAQDFVSRDTSMPTELGSKKTVLHRNSEGNYRTVFGIDNEPERIEKRGNSSSKSQSASNLLPDKKRRK